MLSLILTFAVLSGGDSYALERKFYRLLVARPGKNITTQLRVWAINEEEARENVALNGWQILSIEESQPGEIYRSRGSRGAAPAEEHSITVTKVGEGEIEPYGDLKVEDGKNITLSINPAPCEKLSKIIVNGKEKDPAQSYTLSGVSKDTSVVVIFSENGSECSDNGILNKDLKEMAVTYFELGKFNTPVSPQFSTTVDNLGKNKKYVLIGFTDDVSVIPNSKYKDNFELSVKRAEFIKNMLSEVGISSENIKTIGLGPAFPAKENKKDGQPLNRRVVVYERK
jgi:hypothetical protein